MADLDPTLRRVAQQRAREAIEDANYHEQRAAAARARAQQLARTWNLSVANDFAYFDEAGELLDSDRSKQ
jgi:hypothetical protein